MDRDDILSEFEEPSPEEQDFKETKQILGEPEIIKKKQGKNNKKLIYAAVIMIVLSAGGFLVYKHLLKPSKPLLPKSALLFTPPVSSPAGRVIPDLTGKQVSPKLNPAAGQPKGKPINNPGTTAKESNLNDLFTIKYKKPAKKILTALPGQMPIKYLPPLPQMNFPAINAIKNKLKNLSAGSAKSSFTVLGASGRYVVVQCDGADNYLKIGDSSCGHTLLRTSASSAKFAGDGKIKSYSY